MRLTLAHATHPCCGSHTVHLGVSMQGIARFHPAPGARPSKDV
ncbi:MAG: hypothetical protein PHN79_06370 [Methanoregula sp.]|nr:hypothetical protein [Methanoregula sp.]